MKRKTNNTMVLRKKAQNSFDVALLLLENVAGISDKYLIWDLCINLNFRDSVFIIISH